MSARSTLHIQLDHVCASQICPVYRIQIAIVAKHFFSFVVWSKHRDPQFGFEPVLPTREKLVRGHTGHLTVHRTLGHGFDPLSDSVLRLIRV